MDSLTQIVLGASVAALAVPPAQRRRALVAGAMLGTLPDLDIVPLALMGVDAVTYVTWHRGPSHSLPVLTLLGLLVWWLAKLGSGVVRAAPRRWLAAIWLALLTHPLLDAFTVYGTQLWWPLTPPPTMWSSIFIIDPAYTLPLLAGCVAAWYWRERGVARRWLWAGVLLSSVYLGWSLIAKARIDDIAARTLTARGLADAPRFSVPTPFNTLLWRVVVLTPDGFLEGDYSLVADSGPIRFRQYPSEQAALTRVAETPAVARLLWFTHGFVKAEAHQGTLVLADLRMGAEPDYSFRYAVARQDGQGLWQAVQPEQLNWTFTSRRGLNALWHRIWHAAEEYAS
ncbi:metal-dependent hydrolase [Chitinolyticbacter albus]|uniref:metal-dependent hydrolase n=1 Tax=Chitinolyticbacter albus TaxID=2961951 RepID=UPI00210B66FB|nr:metal-dependent hydrolase [Chitinolyticbacter albus]